MEENIVKLNVVRLTNVKDVAQEILMISILKESVFKFWPVHPMNFQRNLTTGTCSRLEDIEYSN